MTLLKPELESVGLSDQPKMAGVQLPTLNSENLQEVSNTLVVGWMVQGIDDATLVYSNDMAYF